jgi:hypothetical protein
MFAIQRFELCFEQNFISFRVRWRERGWVSPEFELITRACSDGKVYELLEQIHCRESAPDEVFLLRLARDRFLIFAKNNISATNEKF